MFIEIIISIFVGIIGPIVTSYGTIFLIVIIGQLLKDELEKGLYSNTRIFVVLANVILVFVLVNQWIKHENGTLKIVILVLVWILTASLVIRKLSKEWQYNLMSKINQNKHIERCVFYLYGGE